MSSHIFSDDKFPIHKFDHYWIQARIMLEVLAKKAFLFKKVAPEVDRAEDFNGEQNKSATIPYLRKQMVYEHQVDQLENFHLPLRDQMLLLEGANTTTNTIIDALKTAAATREVTLKALTIEDIDKTIVAVSGHMEIIEMLQEAIFSHVCAAADFVESELQATNNKKEGTNNALEIMLAGYCPNITPNVFYGMLRKCNSPSPCTFGQVIQARCIVNGVDSASSLVDMTKLGCALNSLSHLCRALAPLQSASALVQDFILAHLLTSCSTMLDLLLAGGASSGLKIWSCSQHTIKCLLDAFEIGVRYLVLVTSLEELSPHEYMPLEVGFVLEAGTILFKLVEKEAVPWSAFWTTETLQMPMPSVHNVLEELDLTTFNALRSKLHKMFNVGTFVPPSSSPKKLFNVNLVRQGYILWFKKQNKGSLLNVALDNEASKELLWVVNTDKEEQDNTVVSLRLYSNLEDKVLIEGRIVMNITKMEDPCDKMSNYIWDPGKMRIYRRGK